MEGKKNLCAMIPAELHARIMAEKEQLELNTLAEYVERIFTEHFEGGQISMKAERTLAVQIPAELFERHIWQPATLSKSSSSSSSSRTRWMTRKRSDQAS